MVLFTLPYLPLEKFFFLLISHVCNIFLNGLFFLYSLILSLFRHVTDIVNLFSMFAHNALFEPVWIAAQQDISSTTSHVGGNGHSPATSGLGHDLCFMLVIFRIEDVVSYPLQFE